MTHNVWLQVPVFINVLRIKLTSQLDKLVDFATAGQTELIAKVACVLAIDRVAFVFRASSGLTQDPILRVSPRASRVSGIHIRGIAGWPG